MINQTTLEHFNKWEKRWHPLRREWVVYAAHRNQRPWSFDVLNQPAKAPAHDPNCYLCPRNVRISGLQNPDYQSVYVFDNDHPVVGLNAPAVQENTHGGLYKRQSARGIARVICFDPHHNATLADLPLARSVEVFEVWQQQTQEMLANTAIKSLLIFENKGEAVGVSSPHPHCQLYAVDFDWKWVSEEMAAARLYYEETNQDLFASIIAAEQQDELRIIAENEHAIAFVPFFARYAYEVYIFPKQPHANMSSLNKVELDALAAVYYEVIRRYDLLFQMSFPFVMTVKQAPLDGHFYPHYRLHLHFQPPLRQPGLVKFLAGPEIGAGNFMADTIPEEKAAELRALVLTT